MPEETSQMNTDLTQLIQVLDKIEKNQETIIQKLTPSEQQIKEQKQEKQELKKLHDKQDKVYDGYLQDRYFVEQNRDKVFDGIDKYLKDDKDFKSSVKTDIKQLTKDISNVDYNTQANNNYFYLGLVIVGAIFIGCLLYKLLKHFTY
ncbi:Uncharacterised protein [[Clostridium] sordellii]|uniref:hypothetical protein n=1 Tax=Paraclostridium sordellii TaxID=1505 RepID=UPI0005E9F03A|nr:hypothetical protein [Paeniclostridium sordellii]CEP50771.1 Uncharacterised protein [[Clostridium] sordellii] [Paeniclostridium sordellii]